MATIKQHIYYLILSTMLCGTCLGLLCAAIAGCGAKVTPQANDAQATELPTDDSGLLVKAVPAEIRNIAVTIEGLGRTDSLPQATAVLTPAIEGQIKELLARPGERVKKGQGIVQLDDRIARANVAEKIAMRDGLQASLQLLKAPPRPEELKFQESAVEQAKLACEKAQAAVERLRPLVSKGEIPGVQFSDAESAAKQAMLQRDAAQAQLTAMKLGPRSEAIAEAQSRISTADAQVDSAQAQLDLLTLRAPISGILNSLTCQLGQSMSIGTTVGEVVDADGLQVTIWLPASAIERVKAGQSARIWSSDILTNRHTIEITSDANSETPADRKTDADSKLSETPAPPSTGLDGITGKVMFVGRVADPQTSNLPVQIMIDNTDGHFSIGQMLSAAITIDVRKDVLAVPVAAIFDVGQGSELSAIRDDKSVRTQTELGLHDKQWVELRSTELKPPLHAGESVIVDGYNLPDGTQVRADAHPVAETAAHRSEPSGENAKAATNTSASQGAVP
ncbi:MAG TPA: HlyD family efflux transporter periplasmic adaptor subunit [Pirellulales bacterium]